MGRWEARVVAAGIAAALLGLAGTVAAPPGHGAGIPSPAVGGEPVGTPALVEAACREGAVVFYTAQADADEREITGPFQQAFPCVRVSVVSAVTGRLYERIATEAQAGKVQGDLTILTDEALVEHLIDTLLARPWLPPKAVADRYPADRKRSGFWYPGSASIMYLVYNNQAVRPAEAPASWLDVLAPRWKGKITTSPPTIGGTTWDMYYFLREKFGADYWRKLAAQQPKFFTSLQPADAEVARGEFLLSLNCDLCDYPMRVKQGAPLTPVYPKEGVIYVPYPLVLLAHAPHPHAAELLANWYLTKAGQSQVVRVRGAYSARPDVAPAPGKPPLGSLTVYTPPRAVIVKQRDALITEWNQIFHYR